MSLKKRREPAKPAAKPATRARRSLETRTPPATSPKASRPVVRPDRPASAKPAAGSAKSARKPDGKRAAVTSRKPLPAPAAPKAAAGQKTRPATVKAKPAPVKAKPAAVKAKPAPVKGKPAVRFSDADLLEFRNLLTKLRNDLVQKVTYLRDSSLRREDEVNHSEDGTDAFDRLFSLERAGGVQQRIYAIDEALREIDEGTYGICQSCESLIRKQRLLALPFARNCLDCQAAQERRRLGHAAAPAPRRFVP